MNRTGYKAASGQPHCLEFDIKIPYSYQMMMSVQNILRILTTEGLVEKGICAMNRRRHIGMVDAQHS